MILKSALDDWESKKNHLDNITYKFVGIMDLTKFSFSFFFECVDLNPGHT